MANKKIDTAVLRKLNYVDPGLIKSVEKILEGIGLDIKDPSIAETPRRFLEYLREFSQPFNPEDIFKEFDAPKIDTMVVQTQIPFRMVCEHHLLPALGHAHVGYIPRKKVVGLSKIARLVDAVAVSRPSLQEVIGDQVASLMTEHLEPLGTMVVLKASHGCMSCRGAKVPDTQTVTSTVRGIFRDVPQARQEFFALVANEL